MALKTYVLLEHTKPTAQIYQRVNANQRIRLDKRPYDHAYLKQTFTTPEGKNRTARLKLNCDSIWQDEQMKPDIGIPANEPFTQRERDAVKFVNEILMTANVTVQNYLESIPQYDKWWDKDKIKNGFSDEKPLYTLLDEVGAIKSTNAEFKKRLKAANKIAAIEDLQIGQDLMIRLNGSFFTPPESIEEIQNALIDFVDDADDAMLDALLKEDKDVSIDEKVTILIGRAINEKVISFEAIPHHVAKKTGNGGWTPVKEISSEYTLEERKRYFAEFLTAEDGKLLRSDLEKAAEQKETKISNAKK